MAPALRACIDAVREEAAMGRTEFEIGTLPAEQTTTQSVRLEPSHMPPKAPMKCAAIRLPNATRKATSALKARMKQ